MSMQIQFVVFWIAIIVILLLGLIQNKFSKKSQCAIVIFAIFILSFMYSNRTLGLDLRNYIEYYSSSNINRIMSTLDIKSLFLNEYEPLFTLTIVVAKKIGLSVQKWLFAIVFIPSLIFYGIFFRKGKKPLLMFYFFLLIMMFQVDLTRFYLAAPFLCIAFHSDKLTKKGIFYVLAFGFHYSAIFLAFAEIFLAMKLSNKKKYGIVFFFLMGALVLKNIDLSFLEYSQYRFLFKLWYNLYHSGASNSLINPYQIIMTYVINIYPIIMCLIILKLMKKDEALNKGSIGINYAKYEDVLRIGIITSILLVIVFGSVKIGFRILLLTYFILFIPISNISRDSIYDGKISGSAIGYTLALFMYNIFMSLYYVLISIIY